MCNRGCYGQARAPSGRLDDKENLTGVNENSLRLLMKSDSKSHSECAFISDRTFDIDSIVVTNTSFVI